MGFLNHTDQIDTQFSDLTVFAERHVERSLCRESSLTLSPVPGDAGFRRYYRMNTRVPMLAVSAPPESEDSEQFCKVAQYLLASGVRTPRVIAADTERGFMLIEDFGDDLLQTQLTEQSVDGYYSEALTMLLHMQSVMPEDDALLPRYDRQLLLQEMTLFEEWYCGRLLGLTLSQQEQSMLHTCFDKLIQCALAQPQVVVHRDFHSRNILVLGNGSLATIDFQDAVIGPITYDLVSLLKDCYVVWDEPRVRRWALSYATMVQAADMAKYQSESQFLKDFDWMGLQRHIKVLGIFARLHIRDGKSRYLSDLPTVLKYVVSACERYPELSDFTQFLMARVQPRVDEMDGYSGSKSAPGAKS